MIELTFKGSADEIREDLKKLFGIRQRPIPDAPKPVVLGSDALADLMNANSAIVHMPVEAPESPQDAPETKVEESIAETTPEPPQAAPVVEETVPEEDPSPAPEITLVQAREKMNALRQKHGAKAVRAVLDQMAYAKFTDVPAEKYAELMTLCDEAEKGFDNA